MLVFPAGSVMARDGRGPFVCGDLAAMRKIIDASLAHLGRTEMMVDYDHQTSKAAGWVKELRASPVGIMARIEWTAAAKAAIEAGEYRYLSPYFTGEKAVQKILNIALVNMPALDLAAIAAAAQTPTEKTDMDFMAKLRAVLKLPDTATEDEIVAAIQKIATPDEAAAMAAAIKLLKPVALAAGLPEGSTLEAVTAAIKGRADTPDATAFAALKADHAQTATALAALQASQAKETATAFVDGAIRDGRVGVKPLREHYINRFAASSDGRAAVETELAALPKISGGAIVTALPAGGGGTTLSASQKEVATALGISHDDYLKTLKQETHE